MATLQAWQATGDRYFLDTAIESARGLIAAQLESGGWYYYVDFDEKERTRLYYRVDGWRPAA